MADRGGTIHYSTSIDGKPVKEGLDDISRYAQRHAQGFSKLFALEPMGERRGARAITALAEGLTATGESARGAVEGVTAFGRALSVGIVGGAIIGAITTIVGRFTDAHEEALKLETAIGAIRTEASKTGGFEGVDKMRQSFEDSVQTADALKNKLAGFSTSFLPHPGGTLLGDLGGAAALLKESALHGMMPGAYKEQLSGQREEVLKAARETIGKIADKTAEVGKIEEDRFRVSEKQAAVDQEEIRHKEQLGALSSMLAQTDERGQGKALEGLAAEDQIHKQISTRLEVKDKALQREVQLAMTNAQIQLRIANLGREGLTHDQQATEMARERVSAAQEELAAAAKQVEESKDLGKEAQQAAALRLTKAQAGVAGAAGAEGEQAGSQLEKSGAEEAMTAQEKQAQYQQRIKQFEGIRHAAAREGINTDLISGPRYGEAEYDPTAAYRAAVAQEAEQKAKEEAEEAARKKAQDDANQKPLAGGPVASDVGTQPSAGLAEPVASYSTDPNRKLAPEANPAVVSTDPNRRLSTPDASVYSTDPNRRLNTVDPAVASTDPNRRINTPATLRALDIKEGGGAPEQPAAPAAPADETSQERAARLGRPDVSPLATPEMQQPIGPVMPTATPSVLPTPDTPMPQASGYTPATPGYSYATAGGHVDVAARPAKGGKGPITAAEMDQLLEKHLGG